MEITGKTLLHSNYTYYFDDDGYQHDSLEDARYNSIDKTNVTTIRKQNCYMKEWDEMNKWEQEQAEDSASRWDSHADPKDYMYVFGAAKDNLLFFNNWIEFQRELNDGTFTVVEKKRN